MIKQIAYTNSNCQDLWEIFIKENQKHCKFPLYMISDKLIEGLDIEKQLIYLNNEPYYQVWINAVQKFGGDYFIYLQEDFILYDNVNEEKIEEYVNFLKINQQYSFVRLLKTEYEIESTNLDIFSMQPTIWRSVDYIRLMNYVKSNGWLETDGDYRNKMIALNMKGAYHYDNEPKRGAYHYDNNVYPYIATALVKGKWIMSEYGAELGEILKKYNVDINKRGIL
jgi:hypothetical protein